MNANPPVPDQPTDWTEPGAYPVVPGVYRVPLPMPHEGLRAVNLYLIEHADGLLAVDSGWAIPLTAERLEAALALLGYSPSDLSQFVITHAHHDHYSQALALRERFGCEVAIGRGEKPSIEGYRYGYWRQLCQRLGRAGASEMAETFAEHKATEFAGDDTVWGLPSRWLDDGETLELRDRPLEVRATPGHTRGHVILRDPTHGLLFAGDHVLPHITPSIGYEAAPEKYPLRSYLASLKLTRKLPDALLLPAHGPVSASAHHRVDELLAHHDDRFAVILDRVERGDATAFQVATHIHWTRRRYQFEELTELNQALAVMETLAHLDVLVLSQAVCEVLTEGVSLYELPTSKTTLGSLDLGSPRPWTASNSNL